MHGFKTILKPLAWFTALCLAAMVAGCGSGSGGGDGGGGGTGTLGVSLTDAPACGFDAVNVTVSKVRVHMGSDANDNAGGWSEISLSPPRKINLLDLTNGVLEYLGETALPAGHYTQLRLVLLANSGSSTVSNSVVLSSGTPGGEIALITPSAVQSGLKLNHGFDVAAGRRVDLVLDFDACKSVVKLGNGGFLLKPVIKVIPTELNGITGFVDASLQGTNVTVSAQANGTVVRSTVPNPSTGAFFLARLNSGNYDVVVTADNHVTAVIHAVPVLSSTSIVAVSTNAEAITMPASATRNISGSVFLIPAGANDEIAFVTAKQTFGSGTVTVQSNAADPFSDAYLLTLPVGAPLFGQYGAGALPIAFAEQSLLAGQYTVEASAAGYRTQSFEHNIFAAGATQDFILVQ
ncbi:MAG TPA: DUF4382 domain-containing protein [Burkholderiales bacterium]|nr:DUF4382 domain-containing protein [Burkholderiales bacterium]